jgi:hypothetical protein
VASFLGLDGSVFDYINSILPLPKMNSYEDLPTIDNLDDEWLATPPSSASKMLDGG